MNKLKVNNLTQALTLQQALLNYEAEDGQENALEYLLEELTEIIIYFEGK